MAVFMVFAPIVFAAGNADATSGATSNADATSGATSTEIQTSSSMPKMRGSEKFVAPQGVVRDASLLPREVLASAPDKEWAELPTVDSRIADCAFISHAAPDGRRSFSMLYDTVGMFAYWVAYPMHSSYTGTTKRTEAWGYDPKVPASCQPDMKKGIMPYHRGHQMPSADRTSDDTSNAQTFYFTNMTAQAGSLNSGQWAKLEAKVRDWMKDCDTLYIVTGAWPGQLTHPDNDGREMSVPAFYFKALAKRKGNDYATIAFKVDNEPRAPHFMEWKLSVAALESVTGFNFFPSIPISAKAAVDDSQW